MPSQTVTLTLPEPLYERVRETAVASARSVQEILTQSIALSLPPLEKELPAAVRTELAGLAVMSDGELRRLAESPMTGDHQARLELLAEPNKKRPMREGEAAELDELMAEAQRVMIIRAQVYRILAQRGHRVFPRGQTAR